MRYKLEVDGGEKKKKCKEGKKGWRAGTASAHHIGLDIHLRNTIKKTYEY